MFDIGWSELVVIGVVALIVIGPKELPGVLRMAGQWITKVRRMASDFQGQFQEAMREAEMADLKKQVDDLTDSTRDLTSGFDPIASMEEAIGDPFEEKKKPTEAETVTPATKPPETTVSTQSEPPAPEPVSVAEVERIEEASPDALPPQKAAAGGSSA